MGRRWNSVHVPPTSNGCGGCLIVMVESRASIRKMLSPSAALPPSSVLTRVRKNLWPPPEQLVSAADSYIILREIEGVQPLAKGHTKKMNQKKPKHTSPLLLVCKPVHLLPLRESSRKAGIPLGNTGDRLKSRQKKSYFTVSLP